MAALVVCPGCTVHIHEAETRCPHCDTALRTPGGLRVASKVALLMGLGVGLAGCPVESKYGVPATASPAEAPEADPDPGPAPDEQPNADSAADPDMPSAAPAADAPEPDAPR